MENTGRSKSKWWLVVLLVMLVIAGYVAWSLKRPLPSITLLPAASTVTAQAPAGTVAWPAAGEAAVGIVGSKTLETHGAQASLPIASTAKLITALSVLRQKPLSPGQQGPAITLTDSDVALYNSYTSQEGSVVRVVAGEQISEYQMLQAMMLPSANNMADSLAIWAFGSLDAYNKYASDYAAQIGLHETHIGTDASGLSPTTTSSARDLVKLGEIAMQNPVLAQIVGQQTASGLPVVGDVKNVNFLLGTNNIIGIKTGNTDQAGGVFVGAATTTVNGKKVTIVTAVLGSPSLFVAMKDSQTLIQSAQANFKPVTIVQSGSVAEIYHVPWGGNSSARTTKDLKLDAWSNSQVRAVVTLRPVSAGSQKGQTVGTVSIPASATNNKESVTVTLYDAIGKPSAWWRLLHPLQ